MTTILLALFSHRNIFSHSPVDLRSGIKTSDFRGLERALTGPCSPPTALGRVFFYLFWLLMAPSIPWLVAASFQSLAPSSQGPLLSSLSQLLSLIRILLLDLVPIHAVQDDFILLNP